VLLESANEDMIVAKDIIDHHGRVLITAGAALKQETLKLLKKYEIVSISVEDIGANNREISVLQNLVSAATRLKLVYSIQNLFHGQGGIASHLPQLKQCVEDVVEELSNREELLIYLNEVRLKSDYLFVHSVDVGLFSVVIGMAMGLPRDEVCLLGMGGLLHDFGKTRIPRDILDKQGPLSFNEFKTVKEHATFGYNILKTESNIDHKVALAALQHHERPDGRGYPWGIHNENIHLFARIVAVADVYDALTTDRAYRPKIAVQDAVRIINEGAGSQFDSDVVAAFNKVAVPYCIGGTVKLSNGQCGAIVRLNSSNLSRPVVCTADGSFNLLYEQEIHIVGTL
jgi:HD-GYP domain-containing protein (c-di-GMP phosphodiesterase class II)